MSHLLWTIYGVGAGITIIPAALVAFFALVNRVGQRSAVLFYLSAVLLWPLAWGLVAWFAITGTSGRRAPRFCRSCESRRHEGCSNIFPGRSSTPCDCDCEVFLPDVCPECIYPFATDREVSRTERELEETGDPGSPEWEREFCWIRQSGVHGGDHRDA